MLLAVDTETTGLDLYHSTRPFYVTTVTDSGERLDFDWTDSLNPETREVLPPRDEVALLRERISEADELVFHNSKFDVTALASIGLAFTEEDWDKTNDTLLLAHIENSTAEKDLTALAARFLREDIYPFEERLLEATNAARRAARKFFPTWKLAVKGLPDLPSDDRPTLADYWLPKKVASSLGKEDLAAHDPKGNWLTLLSDYAERDSAVTLGVFLALRNEVKRRGYLRQYEPRRKALRIAYKMERTGVSLSEERLDEKEAEYKVFVSGAATRLKEIAANYGAELTIPKGASPNASLRGVVIDKFGLPPRKGKKAKTNLPSLDKEILAGYVRELTVSDPEGERLEFLKTLLAKRSRDTALSFMASYRRFWKPYGALPKFLEFNLLHPSLNPAKTSTLRWSSERPNEQNISKKEDFNLRYAFGPAPGREWYSLDAKNIELRIPAYESGEEAFIALFERPDDPPYFGSNHLLIAHLLFPEEFEACRNENGVLDGRVFKKKYASTLYQRTKNGNFAVQYGAVDREDGLGTADRTYGVPGAQRRIAARFAKSEALNRKWVEYANRYGYVETMPDRTVDPLRGYPLACARTERGKVKPTVPLNYHVQGTAMWWMLKAMLRTYEYLESINRRLRVNPNARDPEGYYLVMQVHDELVFDFPKRADPRKSPKRSNLGVIREIARLMEFGGEDIGVPTPVSIEYHPNNWSEGISLATAV